MTASVDAAEPFPSTETGILFRREWAMPNANTFDVPCIAGFVQKYLIKSKVSIDPFARNKRWATYTNDLDPCTSVEYHMEAAEFLAMLVRDGIRADLVIFDPPYSLEQCARSYKNIGRNVTMRDTQIFGRWTEHKKLISRLIEDGGVALTFGWNTQGIGKKNGFTIEEILMVCHGAAHNDTICMAERKRLPEPELFGLSLTA